MELFNWVTYPSEHRYLTIVFGCKRNPTLQALSLLHLYTVTYNRYPNIDEFILYVTKECSQECEYFVPLPDLIDMVRYSLVEYGLIVKCRIAHFFHSFRVFEQRYPTLQEYYLHTQDDDNLSRISNELLQRDTQEYWEKKQSGITEQDIYKYVQTNEEKDVMCCVCQEPVDDKELVVKLDCNHIFHRGASYKLAPEDRLTTPSQESDCQGIEEWLKRSGTCPICRVALKGA